MRGGRVFAPIVKSALREGGARVGYDRRTMGITPRSGHFRGHPYRNIFGAMLAVIVVDALTPEHIGVMHVADLVVAGLIVAALVETVRDRRHVAISLALGLPAVAARVAAAVLPDTPALNSAVLVLSAVFFGSLIWNILSDIMSGNRSTSERIFGALCAYIFIGVVFALLYAHLEYRDPENYAFTVSNSAIIEVAATETSLLPLFTYYSFVTLTTLGYGDITPVSDAVRTLAWMEALVGQLYLAVMVAGFVAAHISNRDRKDRGTLPADEPGDGPE